MIICCCDGSINGIFTAIYRAWELGTSRTRISVSDDEDMELFAEYLTIAADEQISAKVADSIRRKISQEVYEQVYFSALSYEADRGDAIYRFLIEAFKCGPDIINHLANPYVCRIFELSRNVTRESHNYLGFLRFCQCRHENGTLLLARFDPKNHILDMVTQHFADRLFDEDFMIADTRRNICSLHRSGSRQYIFRDIPNTLVDQLVSNAMDNFEDSSMEVLWEVFRSSIAIESRHNDSLQKQMMPLRYRKYMNLHVTPQ